VCGYCIPRRGIDFHVRRGNWITVIFTSPIVLPAGHYFFRPEVQVNGGDFLFLSAPKPIVAPGQAIAGDLQAWIRNSNFRLTGCASGRTSLAAMPHLRST